MKVMALVVQPDSRAHLTETETDLASIRSLIGGGYLESVGGAYGQWVAYGDEEGRLKGLEPNVAASALVNALGVPSDLLVGPVVFFGLHEENPEDGPTAEFHVPPELVEIANRYVILGV